MIWLLSGGVFIVIWLLNHIGNELSAIRQILTKRAGSADEFQDKVIHYSIFGPKG